MWACVPRRGKLIRETGCKSFNRKADLSEKVISPAENNLLPTLLNQTGLEAV